MLRFQSPNRSSARNYQSRREQWRLLLLVMSLGMVIFAIRGAQRPETIAAVSRLIAGEEQAAGVDDPPPAVPAPTDGESPLAVSALTTDVRPEAMNAIRDNSPFRTAEQEAWFALLATLRERTAGDLASASVGTVTSAQLVAQPRAYRAKLVTVYGTARRVTSERPASNDLGVESYFRLVIQPRGETLPIFAYCLTLPDDFPRGDDVAADVAVTGYFFKNLSYESVGGLAIAPVILANGVTTPVSATLRGESTERPLTNGDDKPASPDGTAKFSELMSLAGWNDERWAEFVDDEPLTDAERGRFTDLLWRLRTFSGGDLDAWSQELVPLDELSAAPGDFRGRLVRLTGRVRRVTSHALPSDEAARLELPTYYECELELDGEAGVATVLSASVPDAWAADSRTDEKTGVSAVFLKRLPPRDDGKRAVLVAARRISWYPDRPREPDVSFGESVLAGLGMDVALLDNVKNHQPIRAEEREAFLAMLAAVGQSGSNQLIRFARGNLDEIAQLWSAERQSPDSQRRLLAREVVEQAEKGLYSVAPLFNDADEQVGRLLALEGVVRRVLRIELSAAADGEPSDVPSRYGFDHYYEMDLFTDDSQNRPIVFCVRELPIGFPTGSGLDERVRVAGFFFKSWHYVPRGDRAGSRDEADAAALRSGRGLISPLLVGRGPVALIIEDRPSRLGGLIGGCLFVLAFAGVWGLVWWYSRDERRFHERTLRPSFALPAGESLDTLNLGNVHPPPVDPPDTKTSAAGDAP